jgi:hypothetical protein
MVPVVALAIIAVAIIKSLMTVVARDVVTTVAPWSPDRSAFDPTVQLRATANDDVHAFLLPAAAEPDGVEPEPFTPGNVEARKSSR